MNEKQAAAMVDQWVNEWRLYLDGGLHFKARNALIASIVAAGAPDEQKPEKRRGRPPKAAEPASTEV